MTATDLTRVSSPAVEQAMTPLCRTEPTVGDVRRVLRLLGQHRQIPELLDTLVPAGTPQHLRESVALGVIQAMCWQAEHVLSQLSEAVQDAPLDGLNELLAATKSFCKGPTCDEWVLPWSPYFPSCSAECRTEFERAVGDIR